MNTKRCFLIGTGIGITVSLINLLIIYMGKTLIVKGSPSLPFEFLAALLIGGAVLGASCMVLNRVTAGKEKSLLMILFSLALAALLVLLGGYSNNSLVPVAIYALAIPEGLFISRLTSTLSGSDDLTTSLNAG